MIYRHHIAPPRAFTQLSHELIRHPRLSSDAVRLLTWQLSLPEGARESLSRTAERARIGATAFTRAKRQLKDEGFVHERRVQGPGGQWTTQQLVSSVPLSPAEAAKLLARIPVGVGTTTERVSPQVVPGPRFPAVGDPATPLTDGHPHKDPGENTSHQPPEPPGQPAPPEPEPLRAHQPPQTSPGPHTPEILEAARALTAAYPLLSPDLRHIPRAMHAELTDLTARWLEAGHPPTAIRAHILRGLPDDGTPVHRPGGLLRHLLRDVPPPPAVAPGPDAAPAPPGPRTSARLAALRECESGRHTQATLFRPTGHETHCARCSRERHTTHGKHT
ncbi:hypothetical protein [Streptomyces triticiradicis]|uniref:Uncharacterized protein n=1 Tax=Streptomyces triticiradicis TaxID=2651189 RepID=A0A7J5DJ87_9ACTN|nr:hypothetical protein [Streptomyces triticiradicis]KAB1988725.1 hypothetical protein F8144_11735 [Streptomyces triticiradicis]